MPFRPLLAESAKGPELCAAACRTCPVEIGGEASAPVPSRCRVLIC